MRFLTGAIILAAGVSVLALVAASALGQMRAVILVGAYLALILMQAAAVRFGARIGVVAWTVLATVGLFLVASALVPGTNQSGQLYWFLLIPLAARALAVQRHDAPSEQRSWRPEIISAVASIVVVALVIVYHTTRPQVAPPTSNTASYTVGLDVALFLISALGLLYVHDLSARETAAELRRLQQLLSVCAWCRNINDNGQWVALEQYMSQRQNVELTHGMCPSCYERHWEGDASAS